MRAPRSKPADKTRNRPGGVRFRPSKRRGQVFLTSNRIADRLVAALNTEPEDTVLEIGAGSGALTRRLARVARRVYAVEVDRRLFAALAIATQDFANVQNINEDILKVDLSAYGKVKIFGNLPYFLSTPILFHLLRYRDSWQYAVLTLQKEFARRLCARPGTREYGSITVVFELFTRRQQLFSIPPRYFSPRPRVASSVVAIERVNSPVLPENEDFFFRVVRAAFSQRRKILANCLARGLAVDKSSLSEIQSATGIDLCRRAETLSVKEFCALSDALSARFTR